MDIPPATTATLPVDAKVASHANNFGFLRLLFASLVIVSHSPQIIDGDLRREPAMNLFGSVTIGAIAVDFFFIISGFLIVGSFLASRTVWSYLLKRVLRIYPAFIAAFLICVLVVAPLSGANLADLGAAGFAKQMARMLTLDLPIVPGSFPRLPKPELDNPMWTITYEFRCYLLVALLGVIGLLRPRIVLGLALACLAGYAALRASGLVLDWGPLNGLPGVKAILREPNMYVRLAGMFLSGGCFYLFRDRIRFDGRAAAAAAAIAVVLLFVAPLAEAGLATFGAYAMFWLAFTNRLPLLGRINARSDISYGVYLYGWPLGALLASFIPGIDPWLLSALTFVLAIGAGSASWFLVEKPFMALKSRVARPAPATSAA